MKREEEGEAGGGGRRGEGMNVNSCKLFFNFATECYVVRTYTLITPGGVFNSSCDCSSGKEGC